MAKKKSEETSEPVLEENSGSDVRKNREKLLAEFKLAMKKLGTSIKSAGDQIPIQRISSGSFILDHALGGGWPKGRINLIYGDKSCSKTTLMLRMIADAQRRCRLTNKYLCELENAEPNKCLFINLEGTFDPDWAKIIGIDINALEVVTPTTAEQTGDLIHAVLNSSLYDVVVLDSLAQMISTAELEDPMEKQNIGVTARMNNKLLKKVQVSLNDLKNKVEKDPDASLPTFFVINQVRHKVGVMFGSPDTMPGGKGQEFYSSVTVKLSGNRVKYYDDKEKALPAYAEFDFNVEKNKVSPPKIHGGYRMGLCNDPDGKFVLSEVIDAKDVIDYAERCAVIVNEKQNRWEVHGPYFEKLDEEYRVFKTKGDLILFWLGHKDRKWVFRREILKVLHPKYA